MTVSPGDAIAALRSHLGDERLRRFMFILGRLGPGDSLRFWQAQSIKDIAESTGIELPQSVIQLRAALAVEPPPTLAASAVPPWLTIDDLGGSCPVQGWGTCFGWKWFFHARHESWDVSASDGSVDPVGVSQNTASTFYHEEQYGAEFSDAGYMEVDEARYFVVRELSRLARDRGWL